MSRIAYFISPHGFGHAARAAAIMSAIRELDNGIRFDIVTQVPAWFFEDSLGGGFDYHDVCTDLGLVQHSALSADLDASLRRLDAFLPFDMAELTGLARRLDTCQLVLCDIAPMGLALAQQLGVPSVLVENFTWDWIYRAYVDAYPGFSRHIDYFASWFATADYHIQTEPVCNSLLCDLTTRPVSRQPATPPKHIREQLSVPADTPMILLTMGGIPESYPFVQQLTERFPEIAFVIPSGAKEPQCLGNVQLLPPRSAFFHPDLVHACDAVVGKAGYSTVSEVYAAGMPLGYILRESFRESEALAAFIRQQMHGIEVPEPAFQSGGWCDLIPELLRLPKVQRQEPDGAGQVARFVCQLVYGKASAPA
ncbi:hypothetical protein [Candidatus Entotheonella palauensis]|uniref:Glycosyl transferase family 28 C-terminal domain-containing protein n=1 Tax=Candidatus Entotheonella gemina TaxID=1429439 RepID=W4MD53_9BACT|nr:hypothetical protein [Candidatus Entotheonella palauensis]ETX07841.1 MAG: hypothetical protein ETSY2_08875 [Candidatus Entotheonella gemina]